MSLPHRALLLFGLVLAAYAALVLIVYLLQDRMVFVGARWGRGAPLPRVPGVSVERLALPGGATFRVALAEPEDAHGVLVHFPGNGEDLRSGLGWAHQWREYGLCVLAVEYPGYGDSGGRAGVDSLMAAAEAAAARARSLADERGLPLYASGSSLGSFCAVHLAARGAVEKLLLLAPPTTLAATARAHYPWLPVDALLRHRFDNLALVDRVGCPVLVLHGERDEVVPYRLGRELAAALRGRLGERLEFVSARGYGHNDLPSEASGPYGARIAEFLRR